jgi:hypothetical protein
VYRHLHNAAKLRSLVIVEAVIGWVAFVLTFVLSGVLYLRSDLKKLQLFLLIVWLLACFGHWILLGCTTAGVTYEDQLAIRGSFMLFTENLTRPDDITKWMEENHCSDASSCNTAIEKYLWKRNHGALMANGAIFTMLLLTFLGMWLMVFLLSLVGPIYDPEDQVEFSSDYLYEFAREG